MGADALAGRGVVVADCSVVAGAAGAGVGDLGAGGSVGTQGIPGAACEAEVLVAFLALVAIGDATCWAAYIRP